MSRHLVLLALLFGLSFFTRLDVPGLVDYDEGCYAEVSRVMYEDGEYLSPQLNDEPFFEKPPLLYWSQILGYRIFGVGELGVRFFNSLAALGVVFTLYAMTRRALGADTALLAALMLGSSLEFFGLARVALTDMILLLFFLLCLGSFFRASERWREDPRGGTGWYCLAAIFAGIAMLAKGAIGLVLPGAAAFIYAIATRRLGAALRPGRLLLAGTLFLAIGFSWYLLLGLTHEGGFAFMRELFLEHHVGRFSEPMQGHSGPVFFYLPVLAAGFLPWTPLLFLTAPGHLTTHLDEHGRRFLALLLLFGGITFTFFSIAATKLPNYILPVLPALAVTAAAGVQARLARAREQQDAATGHWATHAILAGVFVVGATVVILPLLLPHLPEWLGDDAAKEPGLARPIEVGLGPYLVGGLLLLTGIRTRYLSRKERIDESIHTCAIGVVLAQIAICFTLLQTYDEHFREPMRDIAVFASGHTDEDEKVVVIGIRHAPSLNFYGDLQTEYSGKREDKIRAALGQRSRIAIAKEIDEERIQAAVPVEVLRRDRGYLVLRSTIE